MPPSSHDTERACQNTDEHFSLIIIAGWLVNDQYVNQSENHIFEKVSCVIFTFYVLVLLVVVFFSFSFFSSLIPFFFFSFVVLLWFVESVVPFCVGFNDKNRVCSTGFVWIAET